MSTFAVPVVRLDAVYPHPNADRLDIAQVGGFQTIVMRGAFQTGDLAIYVPEGALVPREILIREGLEDKLSGGGRNRVKAIRLRGILSQGLTLNPANYPVPQVESDDIGELLGIEKYEPTIPAHLAGQAGALHGFTKSYDIENIKRYPHLIDPDEYVVLTEKLHGTYCQIGWCSDLEPRDDLFGDGRVFVTSKGLAGHGNYLKNNEENKNNLYVRTALNIANTLSSFCASSGYKRLYIMGEIFGDGVQDLKYGCSAGHTEFRVFDIFVAEDNEEYYLNTPLVRIFSSAWFGLQSVPEVWNGYWGDIKDNLESLTGGNSMLCPDQIREGVVIRLNTERTHPRYGRVILKSVSEDYLLRKGNTTELA